MTEKYKLGFSVFIIVSFRWVCRGFTPTTANQSTAVGRLSDAGLETRRFMSVTGRRCERSLQADWAPSVQERREQSNILSSPNVPRSGQGSSQPQTLHLRPSNETMMDVPVSLPGYLWCSLLSVVVLSC